jgi:hypothetical protein
MILNSALNFWALSARRGFETAESQSSVVARWEAT